jgi:cell division protein FtsB
MESLPGPGWSKKNLPLPSVNEEWDEGRDLKLTTSREIERNAQEERSESSLFDRDSDEKKSRQLFSSFKAIALYCSQKSLYVSMSLVKRWWLWLVAPPTMRLQWDRKMYVAHVAKRVTIMVFVALEVVILFKMVFAPGGALELRERLSTIDARSREIERMASEQEMLKSEIERLKKDSRYQRQIVRDHLGLISKDEFLIIFPKAP